MKRDKLTPFMGIVLALVTTMAIVGCKSDETTNPPAGFSSSSTSLTVAPAGSTSATLSGGTAPYSVQTGSDTTIATASISGSTLNVTAMVSGYTSVVVKDAANATLRVGINVTGAITYDMFPLVGGHQYVYTGYAINTSSNGSTRISDPSNVYRTKWSLIPPPLPPPLPPIPGAYAIQDSTTLQLASVVTVSRFLIITKNASQNSFTFAQTLGPFFRAFQIARTDTTRFIKIADASVGIGGTWTAFDSTYTDALSRQVRLEIVGSLEAGETIADSLDHTSHDALRFRTHRNIFVGGSQLVTNATTSRLWLVKNIGPVQVHIAEDTENLGHFRVMSQKNF